MKGLYSKTLLAACFMLCSMAIFSNVLGSWQPAAPTDVAVATVAQPSKPSAAPLSSNALVDCGENYFDLGGPNGDYPVNQNTTTTICPDNPGEYVEATFTNFATADENDRLTVYHGTTSNIIDILSGANVPTPRVFSSHDISGCMTFIFVSDGSGTASGWDAPVSCTSCPRLNHLSFQEITATTVELSLYDGWQIPFAIYEYEVGLSGFQPGTGAAIIDGFETGFVANITGLAGNTAYDIYVRTRCQNGEYSGYTGPYSLHTAPSCGDYFYDVGGSNGDVLGFLEPSVTICPDQPGLFVSASFEEFEVDNGWLRVFNGWGSGGPLVGSLFNGTAPARYTSVDPTGCLTFVLQGNSEPPTGAGWKAAVECVACPVPLEFKYVYPTTEGVTLEWQNFDAGNLYQWEVGPVGFQPGTGVEVQSGATTINNGVVTGLQSATQYDAYVRAMCQNSQFGDWVKTRFTTVPKCGDNFFDTGGPTANFDPNSSYSAIICPDVPGTFVSLDFSAFELGNASINFSDYDGWDTWIGSYTGNQNPGVVTSLSNSGCLRVQLYSGPETSPGWAATVNCVTCPTPRHLTATSPTTSSVSLNWDVMPGAEYYYYEIVPYGTDPGTGAAVSSGNVGANSIFLTGLESGTYYQAYLRAVCDNNDAGVFAKPASFLTLPSCGDNFYDPGGPNEGYLPNGSQITTICPEVPGTLVQVNFTEFEVESCCSNLSVFDGTSTWNGYIANLTGAQLPQPITSNDPSGCLTFYFNTSGTVSLPGWAATVSCVTCPTPRHLLVGALSSSAVEMSWVAALQGVDSHEWEVGPVGFVPGTGTATASGSTAQSSAAALGLESNTKYEAYVRSRCSSTDASVFIGPLVVQTFPTCGDVFVDNGGANGDFVPNTYYSTTICPDEPGQFVQLDFTEYELGECCGNLTFYDGTPNSGGAQLGQFFKDNSPGIVSSNDISGCLTVIAYLNGTTAAGWQATVNCTNCPDPNNLQLYENNGGQVVLTWGHLGIVNAYEWELGLPGFVPGNGEALQSGTTTNTSLELNGLEGATEYVFYIKVTCSSGNASSFGQGISFKTSPTCGDVFTDSGGVSGSYSPNEISSTIICPDAPGQFISLDFTEFSVPGCCAQFSIFNGIGIKYYNDDVPPTGKIYAYGTDGCLQTNFYNNGALVADGWVADVACVVCPPPIYYYAPFNIRYDGFGVGWTGASSSYYWEVGPTGFVPGTGQATNSGTTNFQEIFVTELGGQTTYDFYVRGQCTGGESVFAEKYTVTTGPTCGDMFYDPAGPDSSYVSGGIGGSNVTIICPDIPGSVVQVTFDTLSIHPWEDNVYVFNGPDTNSPLMASFNGMAMPLPGPFTAANGSGCLTFQLSALASGTWYGWDATVDCVTCPRVTGLNLYSLGTPTLSWDAMSAAESYNWEIGVEGFVPGTGAAVASGNTTSVQLALPVSLLEANISYRIFVQAVCSPDDSSVFGDGVSFDIPPTCGDNFYDSGGPSGTYGYNESRITAICPQGADQKVTVIFNSFNTDGDALHVYNGPDNTYPWIASITSWPGAPFSYTSSDASGCLTFYFLSDGWGSNGDGWDAYVSCDGCIAPPNFATNDLTPTGVNLHWTEVESAASYNYEVGLKGFTPGIGTAIKNGNISQPNVDVSGLTAGVEYDAYVRSICGGEIGDFAGPLSFVTPVSCGSISYDTGGPDGDYGPNEDYYTLICPEVGGHYVAMNFTEFETQLCCDKLEILDGNTESSPSIGVFAGNTLPDPVAATNPTGCLMLHFTSDATTHRSGWAADVDCFPLGVHHEDSEGQLVRVSPNPAKTLLNVTISSSAGGLLQVTDIAGRVQLLQTVPVGQQQVRIPLDGLVAGIYFLRWESEVVRFVVAP